ncbi:ATP-binding protein [Hymenobacter sp. BT559]|uniref:ATP-binding protein n=1 Tax=Hymenobacter sp. BT559 TaxID=2795729 RepID=UPI0018EDD572|nr:ATP-binding protein [Hymenobacter sp. BT559]MBJ6145358.1 HAMP domain-containing protein [Hymenobacter sp. BT559]
MKLKTKITLALVAVFGLLLGVGTYSLYALRRLDRSAAQVLQANFYSVQLGQQLYAALDQLTPAQQQRYLTGVAPAGYDATVRRSLWQFQRSLAREAGNVTELGERAVVDSLIHSFHAYQTLLDLRSAQPLTPAVYFARVLPQHQLLRAQTSRMVQLNMAAITRKSTATAHTAAQVWRTTWALLAGSSLLLLFFVVRVPRAAVAPLRKLLASLRKANQQDFTGSIPAGGQDELGEVARAFNQLLAQLQDYRTSTVAQFKAERNRLASVVNALDEGLLVVDEKHRILVANPVISRLLGVPASQLTGRPAAELAAQNELFASMLRHLEVPATQRAHETPVLTLPQEGGEAYYHLLVNEVVSVNDATRQPEFVGSVLTLRDVSEYRRLDQVKWRFLTTVSQELRGPLSLMQVSLQRLQDSKAGPLTAEQHNIIYTLGRENKHLLKLVHELLDVSQLELGTIQLNFQPAYLHEIVQFVTDTIRPQFKPKRLVLDVQVPDTLPAVRADVEKTTWVLLSLLANAIRYAQMQDTVSIRASLLPTGQHVQVSVQDQGPGIAPEMQERIFQRFTQLPTQSGSGLGLSIAREFMVSQGGQLTVESTPGKGSTFSLTLPVSAS